MTERYRVPRTDYDSGRQAGGGGGHNMGLPFMESQLPAVWNYAEFFQEDSQ